MLLILAVVLIVFLGAVTLLLNATGAPLWSADISRNAKIIWGCGFGIAFGIAALMLGPGILATWPFWVGTLIFTVAAFAGMDKLFGGKPKARQERTITHRDGSRAVVDGKGRGYRRLANGDSASWATGGKSDSRSWASRAIKELWG